MRYLITISYDGSNYSGYQKLKDAPTIQEELEKCLKVINKKEVSVKSSGRTDKGVHALAQMCHFDLDINVPTKRLINAMNSSLPDDIRVIKCSLVKDDFHARFSVKEKTYKYVINMGSYDLFNNRYLYNYCNKLDVLKIKKASKYLIGERSFKPFVSGYRNNYDSAIRSITIKKTGDILTIRFVGKSFYKYMVRNMVGALILVGNGKISIDDFKKIIESNKEYSYFTVPANGLYLEGVKY